MRCLLLACAALGLLGLSGCVRSSTVLKVKPDGSGTLEITTVVAQEVIKQVRAEGAQELFKQADAEAYAQQLGAGVTFVSAAPLKDDFGEGAQVVYAFSDVTKLKVPQSPTQDSAKKDPPLTFRFVKGETATLTIVAPPRPAPIKPDQIEEPGPVEISRFKEQTKGSRIRIAVIPEGKLVQTSSPHVDGNTVTYVEIDYDTLLADEAGFKKFAVANQKGLAELKACVKDLKGIKINPDPETTIEFTAK